MAINFVMVVERKQLINSLHGIIVHSQSTIVYVAANRYCPFVPAQGEWSGNGGITDSDGYRNSYGLAHAASANSYHADGPGSRR